MKFRKTFDKDLSETPLPPNIVELVEAEFEPLLPKSTDLAKWNDDFLSSHANSAAHVQSALAVRQLIAPDSKKQAEKDLQSSIDLETASLADAIAGLHLLDDWGSAPDVKESYASHAQKRWTQASIV